MKDVKSFKIKNWTPFKYSPILNHSTRACRYLKITKKTFKLIFREKQYTCTNLDSDTEDISQREKEKERERNRMNDCSLSFKLFSIAK